MRTSPGFPNELRMGWVTPPPPGSCGLLEIIHTYHGQSQIEAVFAHLKDPMHLGLRAASSQRVVRNGLDRRERCTGEAVRLRAASP
jgi:hypothetical protein